MLLLPFAAVISVSLLPFGLEALLFGLILDVTAEAAPSGTWTIHELADVDVRSVKHAGLRHSMGYDDPRCVEIIAGWICKVSEV